jgi:predicted adenylyl cyclase CyaB
MEIEVELRSFISEEKYFELIDFFRRDGEFISEDYQETYYFDSEDDLRIQKNDFYSKVWLKKGKMHDPHREEIELRFSKEDFAKAEKLFLALGYDVAVKWFRKRLSFRWDGVDVALDHSRGYGHIIELEKMACDADKDSVLADLKSRFDLLRIPITSRVEFDGRFKQYKENWKELTR